MAPAVRRGVLAVLLALLALLPPAAGAESVELSETVVLRAAAVAETADGFVGSTATMTVRTAANGSGHVFLDTFPLTEVDMQGSARLAARVAAGLVGVPFEAHDYFFVIRSNSQQIGGPSAGATLAVGVVAALQGWDVRHDVLMTGTINPDGTVGAVGGVPEKAAAAAQAGMRRFLYPSGQELIPTQQGAALNMTRYCEEELSIECVPVTDVIDAVALMTDHSFERPPLTGNVTGEQYRERLAPAAAQLVEEAEALVPQAREALAALPASDAATALAQRLDAAEATLDRARAAVGAETYYTAASLSFQAGIEARYVRDAARWLAAQDRAATFAGLMDAAEDAVDDARDAVLGEPVEGAARFEAVGAAQVRLVEAEERLAAARALAANATTAAAVLDAVYEASYAAARAETATWWLGLARDVPPGEPVPEDALAQAARDTLTTSAEEIAYVEAVLRSAGVPDALVQSRAQLAAAEAALERGLAAAAMLDAMEASVRASVLLEVAGFGGVLPASKLETKRVEAARAIQGARERGVEPFLAQSAYEFGLSLSDTDPFEALVFLGYARVTANLAGLPNLFGGDDARGLQTRFNANAAPPGVAPVYVAAAFAVGLALGVGAGLTALMPRDEDAADGADAGARVEWTAPPPTAGPEER